MLSYALTLFWFMGMIYVHNVYLVTEYGAPDFLTQIFRKEPFFHGHDNYDQVCELMLKSKAVFICMILLAMKDLVRA